MPFLFSFFTNSEEYHLAIYWPNRYTRIYYNRVQMRQCINECREKWDKCFWPKDTLSFLLRIVAYTSMNMWNIALLWMTLYYTYYVSKTKELKAWNNFVIQRSSNVLEHTLLTMFWKVTHEEITKNLDLMIQLIGSKARDSKTHTKQYNNAAWRTRHFFMKIFHILPLHSLLHLSPSPW